MKIFEADKLGKTIIVELKRGDKIIESISEALKKNDIKDAVIASAVGSIQKLVFHRPTDLGAAASDEIVTVEKPMEVCSLTGSIFNGSPHFHVVASAPDGIYSGHMEPGSETLYLLEVTIVEITGCDLERRFTPEKVYKLFRKS